MFICRLISVKDVYYANARKKEQSSFVFRICVKKYFYNVEIFQLTGKMSKPEFVTRTLGLICQRSINEAILNNSDRHNSHRQTKRIISTHTADQQIKSQIMELHIKRLKRMIVYFFTQLN